MITSVQSLTRVGDRLPNGAVLLARRWTRTEDWTDGLVYHEAVVLALIQKGDSHEYATWTYCLDPQQGEFTLSGHYFDDIDDAVYDYGVRLRGGLVTEGPFKPRILT